LYHTVCSEQQYIAEYFDKIGKDGRYLVDWRSFAQNILQDSNSSLAERFWAQVLWDAFDYACYIPGIYAEWHHLTPLCMYGSVEDDRNYIRLPPGWHLKVHFALCFFFPTHLPLAYSVQMMLNTRKTALVNKISTEEFERYMNDVGTISKAFAEARVRLAKANSERMQNNHYSLILTNASRETERGRLVQQRKELREAGVVELFGDFTQFEVDLYCRRWPHLVGQVKFTHFPRCRQEREHERNENYQDMEQLTLQLDKDIIIAKGTYKSAANERFKEVVASYFDTYEGMPTRRTQPGGPKQVLKEEIVNQLIAEGYRFVIGYKPKTENLSSYYKKIQKLCIVQASVERASLKVESGFKNIRAMNLRNSKKRPATNLITHHFKKPNNPPDNII
jgi:hypothetical protein